MHIVQIIISEKKGIRVMKKEQRGVNVVAGWYTNGAKWLGSRICSPKKEQNVPKERKSEKSSKRVGKI